MNSRNIIAHWTKIAALVAVSSLLGACATEGQRPSSQDKVNAALEERNLMIDERKNQIPRFTIDNWIYVDNYHVIVEAARDEQYLVEFGQPCFALNGAISIGFTSTTGSITKFDEVIVDNNVPRGSAMCSVRPGLRAPCDNICRIKDIIQLADRNQ